MDDATAAAILAVQLQDLEELDNVNGKEGTTSDCDSRLAYRIYQEDLKRQVANLRDWHTAVKFGESPLDNEELLPDALPPIFACQPLNLETVQTTEPEIPAGHDDADQQYESRTPSPPSAMLGLDRFAMEQERLSRKRKAPSPTPTTCKFPKFSDPDHDHVCTACMDTILPGDLFRLPCKHSYCTECMIQFFTFAMKDESLFPPQCCGATIPLSTLDWEVTTEFEDAFRKREAEMGTKPANRTYCSNQECSAFLETKAEDLPDDRVTCTDCHTQTCVRCKSGAHEAGYCAQDPAVISLMETAAQEGYKQCPSCHLIIELTFGCHHMTYVIIFRRQ
ncbi:MAG: hypothetical protein Q9169_002758 [Polycauliona sp. 2 TL-2023]